MGVSGKFANISKQDFMRFADRHEVPYALKAYSMVKSAIASWHDFAGVSGVSQSATNEIQEKLQQLQ